MSGIIKPSGPGGNIRIDIGQAVSNLVQNDLYFEMTLYAIVEVLKSKKDKDGNPILTTEELEKYAKEGMDKIRTASSLAVDSKPNLIVPK